MSKDTNLTLNHTDLVSQLSSYAAEEKRKKNAEASKAFQLAAELLKTCNDIFGVPTTEEQDEKSRQKEYELGQAVALERIGAQLLDAGCDCFGTSQDEKAKWYRETAQHYQKEASELRVKIKKIYDFP